MASLRLQAVLLGLVLLLGLGVSPPVHASLPEAPGVAPSLSELADSAPASVASDGGALPETRIRAFGLFDPFSRPGWNGVSRGNAAGYVFGLWGNRVGPVQNGLWTDPVTGNAYARARWYDARNGVFLTEDPMGDLDSPNMYAFVGWAPSMYTDPEGEALETLWDAASLTLGLVSLGHNLNEGNYGMAVLDAFGVAVDGIATAVPFVPGGVGAALRTSRTAGWLGKAQSVDQASNVAQGALQAALSFEEGNTGMGAVYSGMTALGLRGMDASAFKVQARGMGSTGGNLSIVHKSRKGLGDAETSPWLNDPRPAVVEHLEEFREGGSFLLPESSYRRFIKGKSFIGPPDGGQFITTQRWMDDLLEQAGGDLRVIKKRLGIPAEEWNERLYRVDISDPLLWNARLPSGLERSANKLFRWGGYTAGGMPEIVINRIPSAGVTVRRTGVAP